MRAFALLFALWLLLTGTLAGLELAWGLAAAAAAALGHVVARRVAGRPLRVRRLPGLASLPARVVADFARLLRALPAGRGRWREEQVPRGREDPEWRARRAWHALSGSVAPATIVADVDRERGVAVVHELGRR
jgi:multisubunit Na+/H+ antiporter MnhE subunit